METLLDLALPRRGAAASTTPGRQADGTRQDRRNDRLVGVAMPALGIDGKRALWTALQGVATRVPILQRVDFARLIERAAHQRQIVEQRRLALAIAALGTR